jgi:anti-anti-sigma factor
MNAASPLGVGQQSPILLAVEVHGDDGTQVQHVTLVGEMDAHSAPALRETVADVLHRRRPRRVEVDLHGVSFLDSAGIKALLMCHEDARRADCSLILVDPHPTVSHVLQLAGLLDHLDLSSGQR